MNPTPHGSNTMARNLPDFENPPLSEVALSVQFEPLEQLRTPQIGLLWSEFRGAFPLTEEHPPLDSVIETFGVARTSQPEMHLRMFQTPPVGRVWFLNQRGSELIQVQQDRFIHNWRKAGEGDAYPRYEPIRDTFRSELARFQAFLNRENLGQIVPNQCEVSYVNHIMAGNGWDTHGQLGNVLTVFRTAYSDDKLSEPEDVRLALRYVIRNDSGEPVGRLNISALPVFRRNDNQPMLELTLTARAKPLGEGIDDITRCLDVGRATIVRAFASVTTPAMHQIWERKDG
jgi:uncharacterized protein (TIGR04255 family)